MINGELVKRPLDEEFDTMMEVQRNPCGAWQAIQTLTEQLEAARADAKEAEAYAEELEKAAYAKGYGDCENETSLTEIGKSNEFLHGQIAKYRAALAAMAAERDALKAYIENDADWKFSAKRRLELFREQRARAGAAEAKLAEAVKMLDERDREYNRLTNDMIERHAATVATLTAQVEALRGALIAEREENLWNAYNTGIERDGRWSDACMSDAEWLVRECGLDPDFVDHPADVLKALIPEAAKRVALTTENHDG